ncbi:hypothetical protein JB92DRAFT_3084194 [Gautieria morchelliformis]|nr:hypothetical protein JB92DRAFT_3084194 [Gautieria morchelliformis]
MDEWGTSIWDTPSDAIPHPPLDRLSPPAFHSISELAPEPSASLVKIEPAPFDDVDFGEAVQPAEDDGFGDDFGDFDEGQSIPFEDGDMSGFREADPMPGFTPPSPTATWEPLRLDPLPPPSELSEQVQELLAPVWTPINPEELMTSEGIREVEGLGQMLVTPESRTLYQTLFNVSPSTVSRPVNWTRSRIRRQHLISLGIPINLDEVMPHVNGKPLPVLNITTRPSSAPPGPRPTPPSNPPSGSNTRAGTPRSGTPQPSGRSGQSPQGFGPRPKLNDAKISEMLDLNPDTLPLLPLPNLEAHLSTLQSLTSDTSNLLTYLLQAREALQQNSETYNGLIAELVGEAQKMKSGSKTRTGAGRRG